MNRRRGPAPVVAQARGGTCESCPLHGRRVRRQRSAPWPNSARPVLARSLEVASIRAVAIPPSGRLSPSGTSSHAARGRGRRLSAARRRGLHDRVRDQGVADRASRYATGRVPPDERARRPSIAPARDSKRRRDMPRAPHAARSGAGYRNQPDAHRGPFDVCGRWSAPTPRGATRGAERDANRAALTRASESRFNVPPCPRRKR